MRERKTYPLHEVLAAANQAMVEFIEESKNFQQQGTIVDFSLPKPSAEEEYNIRIEEIKKSKLRALEREAMLRKKEGIPPQKRPHNYST